MLTDSRTQESYISDKIASGESGGFTGSNQRNKREVASKKVGSTKSCPNPDISGTLSCANVETAVKNGEGVNSKVAARGWAKRTCTHVVDSCEADDSNVNEYGIGAFKGAWKTTSASRLCVVILRAVRSDGGERNYVETRRFCTHSTRHIDIPSV